jgi:hypothetical protein
MDRNEREWENLGKEEVSSSGVSSGIKRRVVLEHLTALLSTMRELRDLPGFWYYLGPSARVRFEDFQGELAALLAELRE